MFKHLKKLDVAGATSWIDLPEVAPDARLMLRPAGEANPAYFNAMLKRSGKRLRNISRTDIVSPADLAQNRADDRELFALHVVVGWEGVLDDQDQPVQFSRENAKEFLEQLPDWVFDRVRNHAATPERFVQESLPDPKVLVGNSASGSAGN